MAQGRNGYNQDPVNTSLPERIARAEERVNGHDREFETMKSLVESSNEKLETISATVVEINRNLAGMKGFSAGIACAFGLVGSVAGCVAGYFIKKG